MRWQCGKGGTVARWEMMESEKVGKVGEWKGGKGGRVARWEGWKVPGFIQE